jgi:serine/threonine-protein kinase
VLVGIVAIGLIVAAILFFNSGDEPSGPGEQQETTTTTKKSVPSIKVGDGDSAEDSGSSEPSEETETSGR